MSSPQDEKQKETAQNPVGAVGEGSPTEKNGSKGSGALPLNPNLKVFIRFRPTDQPPKYIELMENNGISIKEPKEEGPDINKPASSLPLPSLSMGKPKDEKQSFIFSGIFEGSTTQDNVWKVVSEHCITKVLEGQNSCIFAYGQTTSGKSFTIFGEDEYINNTSDPDSIYMGNQSLRDRRGLVPRTMEYILKKSMDLVELREINVTCSFLEIYLDQVRDLGKKNTNPNTFESENLEIIEPPNGVVTIKNLTQVSVKTMNDLFEMISNGINIRSKFDQKNQGFSQRAHTIFTMNVSQRDKENESQPVLHSTVNFVDLAGSERIAKSLTEGNKFQEAILIHNGLTALGKCVLTIAQNSAKNFPYKESKLTRILQNSLNLQTPVLFIAHINPTETNHEESMKTVQFADRTKNTDLKGKLLGDDLGIGGFPGADKMVKKLNEDLNEAKQKIEQLQKDYKNKLSEIQKLLSLEIDLDKLVTKQNEKVNHKKLKDLKNFKLQREAIKELENLKNINKELELEIDTLNKKIEKKRKKEKEKQEKYSSQISTLKDKNTDLKKKILQSKTGSEEGIRQLNKERADELFQVVKNSATVLEEKSHALLHRQTILQNLQEQAMKEIENLKSEKAEEEKEYKSEIDKTKQDFKKKFETLKKDYDDLLKAKNEEIDSYLIKAKQYQVKKKQEIQEFKDELFDLYQIASKQLTIIEKTERGDFSSGIKSFNIPQKERPLFPNKQKNPLLFKILDEKQVNLVKLVPNEREKKNQKASTDILRTASAYSIHKDKKPDEFSADDLRIENNKIDFNVNINKMVEKLDPAHLKNFCIKLRDSLKTCLAKEKELQEKLQLFEEISGTVDMNHVQKEKDELKEKYLAEWKRNNQERLLLESQKRQINNPKFIITTKSSSGNIKTVSSMKKF